MDCRIKSGNDDRGWLVADDPAQRQGGGGLNPNGPPQNCLRCVRSSGRNRVFDRCRCTQGLPVETITCDNGFEFARHKTIEKLLRYQVYFTDIHSPQQRGSNENLVALAAYVASGNSAQDRFSALITRVGWKTHALGRAPQARSARTRLSLPAASSATFVGCADVLTSAEPDAAT